LPALVFPPFVPLLVPLFIIMIVPFETCIFCGGGGRTGLVETEPGSVATVATNVAKFRMEVVFTGSPGVEKMRSCVVTESGAAVVKFVGVWLVEEGAGVATASRRLVEFGGNGIEV
jgi:hypothetical protein